ncbi:SWIM zinc finger family protein [Skermanella pratensis]|uniref:SWIM zinc finger family protein n=1 Tax=Skermanella pratensis TaxID=2233999 RepID=UPI00130172C7|nr:SWIM zinc finger family protein [Skermanella pratensis]
MSWYEWGPTRPREAKGGIKARSKRGGFAESWWGRRWIEVLESFDIGGRLGRGRTYARKGQVLDLTVDPGVVAAKVQGSRPWPYEVEIGMKPLTDAQWRKVAEAVSEDTWSAARLIAGEMPETLEDTFKAAGVPLFPSRLRDLETRCACPDWSNPCKHVAAVYYLLAETFDTDPFLLFRLRGRSRDDFVALLGGPVETAVPEPPPVPPAPLRADAAAFWQGRPVPGDLFGAASLPGAPTVLAATLGPLPFWRGEADFLEGVDAAAGRAAARGRKLAEGS